MSFSFSSSGDTRLCLTDYRMWMDSYDGGWVCFFSAEEMVAVSPWSHDRGDWFKDGIGLG